MVSLVIGSILGKYDDYSQEAWKVWVTVENIRQWILTESARMRMVQDYECHGPMILHRFQSFQLLLHHHRYLEVDQGSLSNCSFHAVDVLASSSTN